MITAVLSNHEHPEYGVVSIPFPIPTAEYDHCIQLLKTLCIGDVLERDCRVDEIRGDWPILKRLEKVAINVEELDYLAKRLNSFDRNELAKFQAVAVSRGYFDMSDLINLTFCCQETTVIQNFTDLDAIGQAHYMDTHGGCMSATEVDSVDFQQDALCLILNEEGKITPYGVMYDNGMVLECIYDGRHFPAFDCNEDNIYCFAVATRTQLIDETEKTYFYLPMSESQLERSLHRGGIDTDEELWVTIDHSELPAVLDKLLERDIDALDKLNMLCGSFQKLDETNRQKFAAAVRMAKPTSIAEAKNLIEQIDLFDFVSSVSNAMEYGRYIIVHSGHFNYDGELDEFYDFKKWGEQRIASEYGTFTPEGYICYKGVVSLEELLFGTYSERQGFCMGGITPNG